jgi:hypothetical protein
MDAAKSGSRPGKSAATWLADAKPTPTITSMASGAPWKKASTSPSRQRRQALRKADQHRRQQEAADRITNATRSGAESAVVMRSLV